MDSIKRREFLSATAVSGIAFSICGAHGLLMTGEAQTIGAPFRSAAWPNRRLLDLLEIQLPIVQAPMGGHTSPSMPIAVSVAGGLGSFPCALLTPAQVRAEVGKIRAQTRKPFNLNFFCHATPRRDAAIENAWSQKLAAYYDELMVNPPEPPASALAPFGAEMCDLVVDLKPDVVSFQFGLPDIILINRLKAAGCKIFRYRDNGRGGALARGPRCGCCYCARHRGRRPSRHVFADRSHIPIWYLGAGTAGGGCRESPGYRRGRHCGWARYRRGIGVRCLSGADGYGVPALPRGGHFRTLPGEPQGGARQPQRHHKCVNRSVGPCLLKPHHARVGSARYRRSSLSSTRSGSQPATD